MITREDYLTGRASHSQYYGEICDEVGIQGTAIPVERVRRALIAGDQHLNSIPLYQWDAWGAGLVMYQGRRLREVLKERGDFITDATLVCITKEAARREALREDE